MNQSLKTKRNSLGQSVITSELAKNKSKGFTLAIVFMTILLSGQSIAQKSGFYNFNFQNTLSDINVISNQGMGVLTGSNFFIRSDDNIVTGIDHTLQASNGTITGRKMF